MKRSKLTADKNASPNWAGIDVAAATLQITSLIGGRCRRLACANTLEGHREVLAALPVGTRVVLEATGLHHLDIAVALTRAGRPVMVINPRAAKAYQASRSIRAKTDRVDGDGLCAFAQTQNFLVWTPPPQAHLELRQLARRLSELSRQLTAEGNRLSALCAQPGQHPALQAELRLSARQLRERQRQLEEQTLALVRTDPLALERYQDLRSFKGIGERSALQLLGELLLLAPDMNAKQWVAYAGLDPKPHQSGQADAPRHISRQGSRQLRAALYMPALVAVRFNPAVRTYYERLTSRAVPKLQAIVAVMRKILHAIWGMFRHHQNFDPARFSPSTPQPAA
jgi:transposase